MTWNPKTAALNLVHRLQRNLGLRVFALLIAIGLWMFVNAGQRGFINEFQAQVSYRALPRGLIIMNNPPAKVHIEVEGTRTLLSLVDEDRLTLRLDLAGIGPGQSSFKISPSSFNVPRGTTVTKISPDEITLDIDRIVTRDIPVHLNLAGQVMDGYELGATQVSPLTISVIGPSRYVMPLQHVETVPFDLKGLNADAERTTAITPPPGSPTLALNTVDAKVSVSYAMGERRFNSVMVDVRDIDFKFRVDPPKATVTLRGPVIKLASLNLKGLVYVDGKGVYPGTLDLPVQVDLPDGMQLVRQAPDKVKLKVYREKRLSNAADAHPS